MNKPRITVETVVDAPIEKCWEYFTDTRHVTEWNHASDDWHSPAAVNDLQPGGKFSYRMEAKDGSDGFDFAGTYDEIIPNKRIAFTMGDGRKVEVKFKDEKGKTLVTEIFEAESTNPVAMQKGGWQNILDNFKKHVESS